MAHSIPLSAPDGNVHAHMCGTCGDVYTKSAVDAQQCCTCSKCHEPLSRAELGDEELKELSGLQQCCRACYPAMLAKQERDEKLRTEQYEQREAAYNAAIARSLDSTAAHKLSSIMHNLSEDAYSAGWLGDLECYLWAIVIGGDRKFGYMELTDGQVNDMLTLSTKANGWWTWDSKHSTVLFMPIQEWLSKYEAWKAAVDARRALLGACVGTARYVGNTVTTCEDE